MVARVNTVAFQGIEVLPIDVQVQIAAGLPAFTIVGLPDKAVGESRERVRAALHALGLALPPKRIIVNLSPADVLKEGSHFDLPIALGLLLALDVLSAPEVTGFLALGELALDGTLTPVAGALIAAIGAAARGLGLICPAASGPEAAWAADGQGRIPILAAPSLLALINHFKGAQPLAQPRPAIAPDAPAAPDLREVRGQESAKRALEIAAAGGHNMLMTGPPGSGKSMLAARLPGLMPPLDPAEALEVSMIHSAAGLLEDGRLLRRRPFRDPHHSASLVSLVGGGLRTRPGEISLAHRGVLFLDELPEFARPTLEALRQPLESGRAVIARANSHISYPARLQLVGAMNPCRCGGGEGGIGICRRGPRCAAEYQARLSGPLLDRIDLHVAVPAVSASDLALPPAAEGSADIARRVAAARAVQRARFDGLGAGHLLTNAEAEGRVLEAIATPDAEAAALLARAAERLALSARGWHRVLRVARTLADLDGEETIRRPHIAEAIGYRRIAAG